MEVFPDSVTLQGAKRSYLVRVSWCPKGRGKAQTHSHPTPRMFPGATAVNNEILKPPGRSQEEVQC